MRLSRLSTTSERGHRGVRELYAPNDTMRKTYSQFIFREDQLAQETMADIETPTVRYPPRAYITSSPLSASQSRIELGPEVTGCSRAEQVLDGILFGSAL